MPVRITCPHCHQDLRLPEELYEGPVECPVCGGAMAIRWVQRALLEEKEEIPTALPAFTRARRCRVCGEPLGEDAERCPACGKDID